MPELTRDRLQDGDTQILGSDGLSNQVTPQEMVQAMSAHPDLEDLCEALTRRSLETGAPDNWSPSSAPVSAATSQTSGKAPSRHT